MNDATLQPGDAVGAFKVMEQLGDGRWGPLYKVRSTTRDTWHVLRLPRDPSKATRDSLRREVRLQRALAHANVVTLAEVIEDATLFGLLSEYVEGTNLREVLTDAGGMELTEAMPLLVQLLDAVCSAHALGLVHEALTPSEVLLSVTSAGVTARVTDFGLARATQAPSVGSQQLRYLAPELGTPGARLDARSDVFSLGCIVYEMLSGRPPFDGPPAAGPPPLASVAPDCPAAISDAVTRALALGPDDRFDDVASFARALFDAEPSPSEPPVLPARSTPPAALPPLAGPPSPGAGTAAPAADARPSPPAAPIASPHSAPVAVTPQRPAGVTPPSPPPATPTAAPAPPRPAPPPFDEEDSGPPDPVVALITRVVQFVVAPVVLLGGLGLGGAWLEAGTLRHARGAAELAEAGLQRDLLEETAAAGKVASWGAPAAPLEAACADAVAAPTVEARLAASEKLAETLARVLKELPPAPTPEQELARREVDRMLTSNRARTDEYRAALGDRRAAEARPFTALVDLLGFATPSASP